MSYIQFKQRCRSCGKEWSAAFGVVGRAYIARPPKECPHCKSPEIEKVADGWKLDPVG